MSVIIAGERSGVGKTTITLSLLSFLVQKKYSIQSFKVGPDYIDPMFHYAITGKPCYNLDPILTSENYVKNCFIAHSKKSTYSIIEGVMGLYDGVYFKNIQNYASTAHIAKILQIPVILVIDCSKLSGSVAAIAKGYQNLDSKVEVIGVILNKVGSDRHLELLKNALQPLNIEIFGIFYREETITLQDRHLGLIPTTEIHNLSTIFQQLAAKAEKSFNWQKLLPYLETNQHKISDSELIFNQEKLPQTKIRLAIAKDKAFNFYYQDNFDILAKMGVEINFWSPLTDEKLPANIQGLYFGGGFPEIFAQQLNNNQNAIKALRESIKKGIPTYAECGGLMYLSEKIIDFEQKSHEMIGIIPTTTIMSKKLTLGYRKVLTLKDNCFTNKNTIFWGHEFHRSITSTLPEKPLIKLKSLYQENATYQGWQIHNVYASYIHLNFVNCLNSLENFLKNCQNHKSMI